MEAASCGLPICSNKVGEIPYLWVDEEEYLGNEKNNVNEMAKNIVRIWNEPKLKNKLIENASKKVHQYDIDEVIYKWEMVFNSIK
jgi:glycosyltransferase involved in cell wall biosynthesis